MASTFPTCNWPNSLDNTLTHKGCCREGQMLINTNGVFLSVGIAGILFSYLYSSSLILFFSQENVLP